MFRIIFLLVFISTQFLFADSRKDEFMKVCTSKDRNRPELSALIELKYRLALHCMNSPCNYNDHIFRATKKECEEIYEYSGDPRNEGYGVVMDLRKSIVNDLSIMRFFPHVRELYIAENNITSLDFVKYLPHLKVLDARGNPIDTIEPLRGRNLTYLTFWSKDTNLTAIENMTELDILSASANFSDISPLANLTKITDLTLSSSKPIDSYCVLNKLTRTHFLTLNFPELNENNLNCLKSLSNLRKLWLLFGEVKSVEFAKNFPELEFLALYNNPVTDLSPLVGMKKLRFIDAQEKNLLPCSPKNIKEIKAGISCKNSDLKNWWLRL